MIPGDTWGDEAPWIADLSCILSCELPSVTILVNGGEITWQDAVESVRVKRPIIAIAGSGRAADVLATALNGDVTDHRAVAITSSGLVTAIALDRLDLLAETLKHLLTSSGQPAI
jgi:hypothetical protein